MRFLIGILTGAIVTLLVATAMDAPTHPLLNNTRDLAASGWDKLIHATSSSLFEPAQDSATKEAEDRDPSKAPERPRANATPMPDPLEPAADGYDTTPTQGKRPLHPPQFPKWLWMRQPTQRWLPWNRLPPSCRLIRWPNHRPRSSGRSTR